MLLLDSDLFQLSSSYSKITCKVVNFLRFFGSFENHTMQLLLTSSCAKTDAYATAWKRAKEIEFLIIQNQIL